MMFKIQFMNVPYANANSFFKSEESSVVDADIEVKETEKSQIFAITLEDIGLKSLFGEFEIEKEKDSNFWRVDGTKGLDFVTLQYSIISALITEGY